MCSLLPPDLGDNDLWRASRSGRDSGLYFVVVAAIHRFRRPTLHSEPPIDASWPSQAGGVVVDDYRCQLIESEPASDGNRLMVRSLLEFTIAHQHKHSGVGLTGPKSQSGSDAQRKTLPQRA